MKNTGNKNKNTGNGTFEYIVHPDYKYSWKTFQTSFSYLYNRDTREYIRKQIYQILVSDHPQWYMFEWKYFTPLYKYIYISKSLKL